MISKNAQNKILAIIGIVVAFVSQMGWITPDQAVDVKTNLGTVLEAAGTAIGGIMAVWYLFKPSKAKAPKEE